MAIQLPRNVYRFLRLLAAFLLLLFPILTFSYKSCWHGGFNVCSAAGRYHYEHSLTILDPLDPPPDFYVRPSTNATVDLIMATVVGDDAAWTSNIRRVARGDWTLKQYYADSTTATYHAPMNKGREATMYFTYILAHYDALPDISIFIHAHESPWHVESALLSSMTESLNLIDLDDIQSRGFANLRFDWHNACPAWMRTDLPAGESTKREEPFMYRSFVENFSADNRSASVPGGEVPKVFAAPCCSQFAVTRELILRRPRADYERFLDNLLQTELSDYIYGRTWEHMWQYVFGGHAVDCPVEHKVLCSLYHVCFEDAPQLRHFVELGWAQEHMQDDHLGFWRELWRPISTADKRRQMAESRREQLVLRDAAMRRGLDESWRLGLGDIYKDAAGDGSLV